MFVLNTWGKLFVVCATQAMEHVMTSSSQNLCHPPRRHHSKFVKNGFILAYDSKIVLIRKD